MQVLCVRSILSDQLCHRSNSNVRIGHTFLHQTAMLALKNNYTLLAQDCSHYKFDKIVSYDYINYKIYMISIMYEPILNQRDD